MITRESDRMIVSDSAASSVADDVSSDVSRAEVGFVVGSRPKFADETASLLRGRLRAAALALTVILGAAFVGNLLGGTFSFWWLRLVILLALAVCWMVLRSQRALSLPQLRMIEVVVFGVVVLQVALMMHIRPRRAEMTT